MENKIKAVKAFHTAFGLGMKSDPTADLGTSKKHASIQPDERGK